MENVCSLRLFCRVNLLIVSWTILLSCATSAQMPPVPFVYPYFALETQEHRPTPTPTPKPIYPSPTPTPRTKPLLLDAKPTATPTPKPTSTPVDPSRHLCSPHTHNYENYFYAHLRR